MRNILILAFLVGASPVWAADAPMVVTLDKAQMIHLPAAAQRVIVGNPAVADVSVEQPTLLAIFGKAPGETSLTVLGSGDKVLLNRSLVVTISDDRQVTVHTSAEASRQYSCLSQRCLKVASPETSAPAAAPALAK